MKFGDYVLPHALNAKKQRVRLFYEVPLSGRPFAYRKDRGGKGLTFTVDGYIRPSNRLTENEIDGLSDGVARILDFEPAILEDAFERVLRYESTPAWTDNSVEAKSAAGTPFPLLSATTDYHYFGHREKVNQLQFLLETVGVYGVVGWEYSLGNGLWSSFDDMYDDFLGYELNTPTTLWTLLQGSVSIADSLIMLMSATNLQSLGNVGPYWRMTFRGRPLQTNYRTRIYPVYDGGAGNNQIVVEFNENGHLFFTCIDGSGYFYIDAGVYDTVLRTYVVTWQPGLAKLLRDGVTIATIAYHVPTAAGTVRFEAYTDANLELDYVKIPQLTFVDGTSNFSQDGTVQFTSPTDWKPDTVNLIPNRFWMRVSTQDAITTPATVNQILMNAVFNCLMLDPQFQESATQYKRTDYTLTFQQCENP